MNKKTDTPTSGIISCSEAIRLLGQERLDKLALAVLAAWQLFRKRIAPTIAKPSARFVANAMHDLMVQQIEQAFAGEVVHRRGRTLLCAVPNLVIQCKKLDERGLPRNYPTRTARRFYLQMKIPGIPEGTRLTLGYILNSMRTEVSEVRLVAQRGDQIEWSHELAVNQTVMPIYANRTTVPGSPAVAMPKKRKLKAKRVAALKREKKPKR